LADNFFSHLCVTLLIWTSGPSNTCANSRMALGLHRCRGGWHILAYRIFITGGDAWDGRDPGLRLSLCSWQLEIYLQTELTG